MKLFAISALMLGAAFVTPALAQTDANASGTAATSGNAAAASPAQPAQDANTAAVPAQAAPAQSAQDNSAAVPAQQSAMNGQQASSGNTQMAMNTTGNAADLSSIPDNQHKYSRAKKASQNRSEGETTKALNQKEASLSGASSTSSAQ